MQYKLVLQLPASSIKDYSVMTELEETIMRSLGNLGKLEGDDAGSAEMNTLILTNHRKLALERAEQILGTKDSMADVKGTCRKVGKDDFTILHPIGLTYFTIA